MLTFYKNKIKNIDVLVQVEDAVVIFFFIGTIWHVGLFYPINRGKD